MVVKTNISQKMEDIAPFYVMDVVNRVKELEKEGRDIVRMEVGEPDFDTAEPIVKAGIDALKNAQTKYTSSLGIIELREKIAEYYWLNHEVNIPVERIMITNGASGALLLAMGVLLNSGDKVILSDPGYPCNRHFVKLFEGEAISVPVGASTGFQLDSNLVEQYHDAGTKAVIVSTP